MSGLSHVFVFLKGMAMGAADVVPGVSGGTIAFITGIYEKLLDSISAVNLGTLKLLRTDGIKATWNKVNGNFLVALLLGIAVSIVSLAKLISTGLEEEPVLIWSFFFGLIVASIPFMGKQVSGWSLKNSVGFILGAVVAYVITILPASSESGSTAYIFMSGCIAICAMILPGISGSFILLLLGSYATILGAIHERDLVLIGAFGAGCVIGLLSFARLLKWLFEHHKDVILAVLTGFLLGSLNKVWPWKETTESVIIDGKEKIIQQVNYYPELNDIGLPLLIAAAGFMVIFVLERAGKEKPVK